MKPHLLFCLILFLCVAGAGLLRADASKPAYLDPNYTGPAAPGEVLPAMELPASQAFTHPGILHSQADLDFVRKQLAAGEEPWTSALAALRADEYTRLDYQPRITPVINPHDKSVGNLMKDATAAYDHALLWSLTGERAHADKAIQILDAAGSKLLSIDLGRRDQGKVTAGFTGGKYASAAELIAHYRQPDGSTAGWSSDSAEKFRQMLATVFQPRLKGFKPEFNGNWDASMMASMMAIAVFCDNHEMFNEALSYFLNGQGNGAITHYIYPHGQNQESARDQVHGQMGLAALAACSETARQQGLDLYSVANNRLAAGYEYMARYLAGHPVEVVGDAPISEKGRKEFRPGYELIYQHYVIEKGLDLPYVREAVLKRRPEGMDLIILPCWGTLAAYRGPAIPQAPSPAPTIP
ncbi:MAG: hypothetical protein BGO12_10865 [Verrucomicrobia bacterium 61-8]|nr:alginate lyase family protein [Verrucomicrobiota bacterium]OJV04531.1 MAG: hypothetical protein BGO12_10865 [Verrucomicrobia bacterium 61-8]